MPRRRSARPLAGEYCARVTLIGRRRELAELQRLLDRAAAGSGGVLVLAGPDGSGRTALANAAAQAAGQRGFAVHRAAVIAGRPGRWAWAQLLRDVGAPEEIVSGLLADPGPLELDTAAAALCGGPQRRLLVVDHADRGGAQAIEMLGAAAGRVVTGQTAVLVTTTVPLGVGPELWLDPLTPAEIGAVTGERRPRLRHALWAASHGLPGPALALAAALAGPTPDGDPVVQLALLAESAEGFLDIDAGLIRLLETALDRAAGQDDMARLLARLARALLGDAASADRRRGLFWRFVALMELGRVSEAESALAAFEREARAAGDAAGLMMVTAGTPCWPPCAAASRTPARSSAR